MIRKIIHSPQALIGLAMMLIVFLVMVFAPFLAPNDPMQLNVAHSFAPPDTQYPLGTDELGRCVLSRLIYGARESLSIALPTLLLLAIISTVIATLCAYLGGIVDRVFEVVSNIFMAFPPFLVAITLVGLFESKVTSIILSIVIARWFAPMYSENGVNRMSSPVECPGAQNCALCSGISFRIFCHIC